MKTPKTNLLALILAFLLFSPAFAETPETTCRKEKDPWKTLLSIMHSHNIDTTNLDVTSLISTDDLIIIDADLAQAYGVKEPLNFSKKQMLGEVITSYMTVKYGKRNKEKFDYYKIRYNPYFDEEGYNEFMARHPKSRYANELKSKALCLDQYFSWIANTTNEECYQTYNQYGESYCSYPGFTNLAHHNNLYRKTLEDWDELQNQLSKTDRSDCEAYDIFLNDHLGHLDHFILVIPDSIAQCQLRQQQKAWREAYLLNSIKGYQDYLKQYPDSKEAFTAERKIKDLTAWQNAVDGNSHESYRTYYNDFPFGDSVSVAGERLKAMEETAWQKAHKKNTIASYENFLKQYPKGYYADQALNQQLELEIKKFNSNTKGTVTKLPLIGPCAQRGYSLLCFGNIGYKSDITVSLMGNTPVKAVLKPGESQWAKVKNGKYKIYVTSSNGSEWKESGHGNITVEDGLYTGEWYSYTTYSNFDPYSFYSNGYLTSISSQYVNPHIDKSAEERIDKDINKRKKSEIEGLLEQDMNTKRSVLRNVMRQSYEENNKQKEYEEFCRDTESDDYVDLILRLLLLD